MRPYNWFQTTMGRIQRLRGSRSPWQLLESPLIPSSMVLIVMFTTPGTLENRPLLLIRARASVHTPFPHKSTSPKMRICSLLVLMVPGSTPITNTTSTLHLSKTPQSLPQLWSAILSALPETTNNLIRFLWMKMRPCSTRWNSSRSTSLEIQLSKLHTIINWLGEPPTIKMTSTESPWMTRPSNIRRSRNCLYLIVMFNLCHSIHSCTKSKRRKR